MYKNIEKYVKKTYNVMDYEKSDIVLQIKQNIWRKLWIILI